jgi:hypothetical protein
VLEGWIHLASAIIVLAPLAILWLRRRNARVLLHAVRHEAESWALESRNPHIGQVLRHGFRVGMASLFAPMGLSAFPLMLMAIVVEPVVGVRGMAALTLSSMRTWDAPWLLIAIVSVVPLWLVRRWAHSVLLWALGDVSLRPVPPPSIAPARSELPIDDEVYQKVMMGGALRASAPRAPIIEEPPMTDERE